MKKGILAFFAGLLIGAGPVLHVIYIGWIVVAFFVGKHIGAM